MEIKIKDGKMHVLAYSNSLALSPERNTYHNSTIFNHCVGSQLKQFSYIAPVESKHSKLYGHALNDKARH